MEVNFNRQTIISFPNNDQLPDITPESDYDIADASLMLDEVLYSDRFTIGTYSANRFEVELYNYPTVGAEEIYVYQIIDEAEGEEPIEVPIFTGIVDSCTTNRGRNEDSKKIVAYDILYSKGKVDVAEWWEDVFDTATSVTLKALRDSLMTYMELEYDDDTISLPNDSLTIKQTQQLNTISFEAMFKYILELNATNANVTREGKIQFITKSSSTARAVDYVYAQNTSEFDTYTVPAYQAVRITNSSKNKIGKAGDVDKNFLDITDNLLILDKGVAQLNTIASAIYEAVKEFTYKPAKIDMIWNQLDIKVGDLITIGANTYLVCENYLSGSLLVDQQISSSGGEKIEDTTSDYDAATKDMQEQIEMSSMKYYRYTNRKAVTINATTKPIVSIKYTSAEDGVVIFHGCVIIDVERIDTTKEAKVELQYVINSVSVREYVPTETYHHDGRHTLHMLHFWEAGAGKADRFIVNLTAINCKITIGAFRLESYMEGMGLVGDAVWDGYIDIEDNISLLDLANEPNVVPFTDTPSVVIDDALIIEPEDSISEVEFENEPEVLPIEDGLYLNKERLKGNTWGYVKTTIGTWGLLKDDYGW